MINFKKDNGLVPAIIQDSKTKNVLMLGYMNEEAYEKTVSEKIVTFFSRSKKRLWTKGETSGNFLKVVDIQIDCDNDTLLIKAEPTGVVCHTGAKTCFVDDNSYNINFLEKLEEIIKRRKKVSPEKSYVSYLFSKGLDKIAQKVGEEAVETIIASKNSDDEDFLNESADLIFHFLVLLEHKNLSFADVMNVLENRNKGV